MTKKMGRMCKHPVANMTKLTMTMKMMLMLMLIKMMITMVVHRGSSYIRDSVQVCEYAFQMIFREKTRRRSFGSENVLDLV
jgi:hypothetical protein